MTGNGRIGCYPRIAAGPGAPQSRYLLTGKEWDETPDLYTFGARYYDPEAGVWLTQDEDRGERRQPQASPAVPLHRTLYVFANPVNRIDPYGYRPLEELSLTERGRVGSPTVRTNVSGGEQVSVPPAPSDGGGGSNAAPSPAETETSPSLMLPGWLCDMLSPMDLMSLDHGFVERALADFGVPIWSNLPWIRQFPWPRRQGPEAWLEAAGDLPLVQTIQDEVLDHLHRGLYVDSTVQELYDETWPYVLI